MYFVALRKFDDFAYKSDYQLSCFEIFCIIFDSRS